MWVASLRLRHTTAAASETASRSSRCSSSNALPLAVRLYTLHRHQRAPTA